MIGDVIKEYLIRLGYVVDTQGQGAAARSMADMDRSIRVFQASASKALGPVRQSFAQVTEGLIGTDYQTRRLVESFSQLSASGEASVVNLGEAIAKFGISSRLVMASAGVAAVAMVAASTVAIGKFTADVAASDLAMTSFARRLWMSTDAARAYSKSLEALGVSLQDVYLNGEVMERFVAMRGVANQLTLPGDFSTVMRNVRDFSFQFSRLRLEIGYGVQWLGYNLAKELNKPLADGRSLLQAWNDEIVKNIPQWTATMAKGLGNVAKFALDVVKTMKQLAEVIGWALQPAVAMVRGLVDMFGKLPEAIHTFLGALAAPGATVLVLTSPILAAVAAISGLFLLLQDYYVYQAGGVSALAGMWQKVDQGTEWVRQHNPLEGILNAAEKLRNAWDGFVKGLEGLMNNIAVRDALQWLTRQWENLSNLADKIIPRGGPQQPLPEPGLMGPRGSSYGGPAFVPQPIVYREAGGLSSGARVYLTLSQTNYITEARDASSTAKTVNDYTAALLMRTLQGVQA